MTTTATVRVLDCSMTWVRVVPDAFERGFLAVIFGQTGNGPVVLGSTEVVETESAAHALGFQWLFNAAEEG